MKELYYIRGNKENSESVKQALLGNGGINECNLSFNRDCVLYYISKDSIIKCVAENTDLGMFLIENGIELQPVEPVEPKETFKPFDKVIVKCRNGLWTTNLYSYKTLYGTFRCGNDVFDECHHYEAWMDKFVGTNMPLEI